MYWRKIFWWLIKSEVMFSPLVCAFWCHSSLLSSPASPVRSVIIYWSSTVDTHTTTHCSTHITHLCSTVPVQPYEVDIIVDIKSEADIWQIEVDVDVEQVVKVRESCNKKGWIVLFFAHTLVSNFLHCLLVSISYTIVFFNIYWKLSLHTPRGDNSLNLFENFKDLHVALLRFRKKGQREETNFYLVDQMKVEHWAVRLWEH